MVDRETQAIEVLKLLGDDTAEAVLSHLPGEVAVALRERIQTTENDLPPQDKRAALRDFETFFGFAVQVSGQKPGDSVAAEDENESAEAEEQVPQEEPPPRIVKPFVPTDDAMADLAALSVHQLAGALETEQPRTAAILLNNISPELSANILSFFPKEFQEQVARQLSREQNAPQVLVERIARATVQRGMTLPPEAPDRRDHVEKLAEVLRAVPKAHQRDMMTAIEEEDADLAAVLLKKLYRFEDLITLDQQVIQQILGEIDATTLTTALFGADDDLVQAILGNLSRRARQTIEEEMEFMTRVPEAKVTEARDSVAELIGKAQQEE